MTEAQRRKVETFNELKRVIQCAEDVTNDPEFMYYFDGPKRCQLLADLLRAMEAFGDACDVRTEEMLLASASASSPAPI